MQMLSAAEAISPAWERTKQILIAPRSPRLYLKLTGVATVAALANGLNFNFNLPLNGKAGQHPIPPAVMALIIAGLSAIIVIGLLIALALFYLGSRMQFVLFEVVATRQTLIAPLWRKYGATTWKWIGLKVAIFVGFIVLAATLFAPFFISIFRHARHAAPNAPPTINFVLSMIGFLLGLATLVIIFIVVLYQTLDFVLPAIALEGSISAGLHRLGLMWRYEPGQMLLYLLLRLLLGVVFGIAVMAVMLFGILLPLVPAGGLGFVLWHTFHGQGFGGQLLLIGTAIISGLILLSWVVLLYVATAGFVMTFHQAYALYFLGGRYPLLGNLLEPPFPAYPYAPPPTFQPITPPPPEPAV